MQEEKNKKRLTKTLEILIALSFVWLLLTTVQSYAFSGVFGGIMSVAEYCTCSVGHIINVGPPRPGRFHYVPGSSQLFAFGQINRSGVWVLGTVSGNSPCIMEISDECVPIPHEGDIELVGTSR